MEEQLFDFTSKTAEEDKNEVGIPLNGETSALTNADDEKQRVTFELYDVSIRPRGMGPPRKRRGSYGSGCDAPRQGPGGHRSRTTLEDTLDSWLGFLPGVPQGDNENKSEGQIVSEGHAQSTDDLPPGAGRLQHLLVHYRRHLGMTMPGCFFHFWWWALAIRYNLWHLFATKYFLSITMILGSIIAGMTSVGGGAVAFPAMTLAFNIKPYLARDFALMIQACGMSAASFTIFFMKIQLDWASLIVCSLGGIPGIIFGLEVIDPRLTASQKKMGFVSVWFSFAFALFLLNRYSKRKTFHTIPDLRLWKVLVLAVTGFVGGLCSSFAGSGLDICSFSILTLLFRVSEKTATPTSVVMMAGNSTVGMYWRHIMMGGIEPEAWEFLFVCVPVVVIGAPLGSLLGSHFHRLVLAFMIYLLDTIALVSAFVIVPLTPLLIGASIGIIVAGFFFFLILTFVGNKLLESISKEDVDDVVEQTKV